jgi:hypothetical protein
MALATCPYQCIHWRRCLILRRVCNPKRLISVRRLLR